MKIFIVLLLLTQAVRASTFALDKSGPNRPFMNFFLEGYLGWFEKVFKVSPTKQKTPELERFTRELLSSVDHWQVRELPEFSQLLLGESISEDGYKEYHFQVFIPEPLRKHPALGKLNLGFAPVFMNWSSRGSLCFTALATIDAIPWAHVPREKESHYLMEYCRTNSGSKFELRHALMTSRTEASWFNPFKGLVSWELRRYDEAGLSSVFYVLRATSAPLMPKKHLNYIFLHIDQTYLALDKLSVDRKKNLTIYFP